MNKIFGIFSLLIFVCVFTTVLASNFVSDSNLYNTIRWSSLFGILGIGVAFVIITGGIDLSIGSTVGLIAVLLPMLLNRYEYSVPSALAMVLGISVVIGLTHGLLVTRLELQPFVVTLCGLLFYRGLARWLADDQTQGFGQAHNEGLRLLAVGKPCSAATLMMCAGVAMLLFCLLRAWLANRGDEARRLQLVWAVVGLVTAVVGSSRFWHGCEIYSGPTFLTWNDWKFSLLAARVPEAGGLLPRLVMFRTGLSLLVVSGAALLLLGLLSQPRRVVGPALTVLIAVVLFVAVGVFRLAPLFESVNPSDRFNVGIIRGMSGELLRTLIMLGVFLIVGLLMGAVAWLMNAVVADSLAARLLAPFVFAGAVLWLLGMTHFAETMIPMPTVIMISLALLASLFLNQTIYGRYLLALGRNEQAARLSGINTGAMTVLAYVICSAAAGLGGILFALDINSVQPSGFGNFYELYAIAAAVLGGCSLRGGEGTVLGVVIGAAVMRVLYNAINILGIDTKLEFAIIGLVILTGAIVDVVVKRMVARRRAILQAQEVAMGR